MWGNRKRRAIKIVKIEPLKVLHKTITSGYYYEEYEITELRYKVKTKPSVHDSTGKNHYIYRNSGVYYDTPKNRELLSLIQKLNTQKGLLDSKVSEFFNDIEKVDVSKLHERTLKTSDETGDKNE